MTTSASCKATSKSGSYLPKAGFIYFDAMLGWPQKVRELKEKLDTPSTNEDVTLE